jgi:hypothetical protein
MHPQWSEPDHGDLFMAVDVEIATNHYPQPEGHENYAWTAWYADDEPDYDGAMNFGYGSTQERAVGDLILRFPREDR